MFPSMLDSIVGRIVIDSLEPAITADDNGETLCGRSHVNSRSPRGSYERWFEKWCEHSEKLAEAAKKMGYAYVLETDVREFFPSIDRSRARRVLTEMTRAHEELLELLFLCLDSWAARPGFGPASGLPIEPNDISRLVAHSYLKPVDEVFRQEADVQYLRWCDDTVVFVATEERAEMVRQAHLSALAEIGLDQHPEKTKILKVDVFEAARHGDMNANIDRLMEMDPDPSAVELLVEHWRSMEIDTPRWDQIMKRIYTLAGRWKSSILRESFTGDLDRAPLLLSHILLYLRQFETSGRELRYFSRRWRDESSQYERVEIARFLGDARIPQGGRAEIVRFCLREMERLEGDDALDGHSLAFLLLLLFKFGDSSERRRTARMVLERSGPIADMQFRHMLWLFSFAGVGGETHALLERLTTPIGSSDGEMTQLICRAARGRSLKRRKRVLNSSLRTFGGFTFIPAGCLPLVRLVLENEGYANENVGWIDSILDKGRSAPIVDRRLRSVLDELRIKLVA